MSVRDQDREGVDSRVATARGSRGPKRPRRRPRCLRIVLDCVTWVVTPMATISRETWRKRFTRRRRMTSKPRNTGRMNDAVKPTGAFGRSRRDGRWRAAPNSRHSPASMSAEDTRRPREDEEHHRQHERVAARDSGSPYDVAAARRARELLPIRDDEYHWEASDHQPPRRTERALKSPFPKSRI